MTDPDRRALAADYLSSLTDTELHQFVDEARGITEARELVRHLFNTQEQEPWTSTSHRPNRSSSLSGDSASTFPNPSPP
ncbi:hypothetical protein [Rhodococcus pyridinivorans]|uniref:hypothetical protein n=1 Tax=Rhodococcus pyridinivorans TaxID=103816 RepID=UPI00207852D8|nr:hypothetical protein [Rhodococcus pyridinivorans]USI88762.1 hypothetical protein LLA01_14170 [Rhodococcus pyridinivorans]